MTSTGIALVLLIAQLVCPSFAQQGTLEKISPEDGLCLGDIVIYSCSVEASHQLVWRYTDSSGTILSHSFVVNDPVNSNRVLGPLELKLTFTEPVSESTGNIVSTATFASGLTAAEEGAVITCVGTNYSSDVVISFAAPSITNVSYCMSTIYWSPPPCEANCTVTVDGQDIGSIPCESRNLNTDDSNLSNKMVMIVATDAIGSSLNISTVLNSEDCSGLVEMSTTTTMSSVSDDVRSTDSPVDSGEIAGIVFGVVFATCIAVISAIIVLIIFYRYRKKRSGSIPMSSSRKQEVVPKSITVDSLMVQEDYHKYPVTHCAISPDAKYMYAATADTSMEVRLWEIQVTCQGILLMETLHLDDIINGMKYADQKIKALLTIYRTKKLLSLNWIQQEERSMLLLTYNIGVFVCDVSNKTVRLLYEPDGVRPALYMRTTTSSMLCTACSASHSTVALSFTRDTESTSLSGELQLASINDFIKKGLTTSWKRLFEQDTPVLTMSFSPSDKKLVTGNIRGGIRIYTNVSNSPTSDYFEWRAHEGQVYDVQFGSADGETVYSLGEDRKFYVWATSTTSTPLKKITFDNPKHAPQLTSTLTEPVERGINDSHPAAGKNNLFRFCFEYEYILISSVEGKVVHKVDSHFNLTGIDLELPKGPISCLDCITESLDNAKEMPYDCTTCILGSTDNSVKFVTLRYGYEGQPGSTNQHHGGIETHGVSGGEGGDARVSAGNRVYYEANNNQPFHSGSFFADGDSEGQQAPSAAEELMHDRKYD